MLDSCSSSVISVSSTTASFSVSAIFIPHPFGLFVANFNAAMIPQVVPMLPPATDLLSGDNTFVWFNVTDYVVSCMWLPRMLLYEPAFTHDVCLTHLTLPVLSIA